MAAVGCPLGETLALHSGSLDFVPLQSRGKSEQQSSSSVLAQRRHRPCSAAPLPAVQCSAAAGRPVGRPSPSLPSSHRRRVSPFSMIEHSRGSSQTGLIPLFSFVGSTPQTTKSSIPNLRSILE